VKSEHEAWEWDVGPRSLVAAKIAQALLPNLGRGAIALSLAMSLFATAASAQISTEDFLELKTMRIYPGDAPGAKGAEPGDVPSVTVVLPWGDFNGVGVIVAPGGGYVNVAGNIEGRQLADWFAARGVTAFVLNYRTGPKYLYPVPLEDAQRALRFVRANAGRWGLRLNKIGFAGFSAGGHLAAMAGTSFHAINSAVADPVERFSDRPDFLVLAYPGTLIFEPGKAHRPDGTGRSDYCMLMQLNPCDPRFEAYSPHKLVRADTPPTFLYMTNEDVLGPQQLTVMYDALREKKVPVEMHMFGRGAHSSGVGGISQALSFWPLLLDNWLRGEGFLGGDNTPAPRK